MLRRVWLVVVIAVFAVRIAAQAPASWKVRIDGSPSATAPDANPNLKVEMAGKGVHVMGGPGAIFWDPAQTMKGLYTVKATFTLLKPAAKMTPYGLVFGGLDV